MQLKKKLSLILACVVSICCLNIGAVAVETQWDSNYFHVFSCSTCVCNQYPT